MISWLFVAVLIYLAFILLIGFLSYRHSATLSDFVVGGRSLNYYVTALSAHASDMSGWLFLAYPALVFTQGLLGIWSGVGLLFGMWVNWQFVAPKLRRETERYNSITLLDYFSKRFADRSGVLTCIGGVLTLFFFTFYISSGLIAIHLLFAAVVGATKFVTMTATIVVVVAYVFVGGYYSICWVDLWQALFLLGVILFVPAFVLLGLDVRLTEVVGIVAAHLQLDDFSARSFIVVLFATLGWGLGYLGQVHILAKFMGIKDPGDLRKSKRIGLLWQFFCLVAATAIGLLATVIFQPNMSNPELIFVDIVTSFFHPFVVGIVLCGVLAAMISTMDSQIIVLVSALAEDVYHRFLHKNARESEKIWVSRALVIGVALVSYVIAICSTQTVLQLVFYAWSGLGSTFGAIVVMALHSKHTNIYGACFGMIYGGVVAAAWPSIQPYLPIAIPPLIPGLLVNLPLIYCVSRLTRRTVVNSE